VADFPNYFPTFLNRGRLNSLYVHFWPAPTCNTYRRHAAHSSRESINSIAPYVQHLVYRTLILKVGGRNYLSDNYGKLPAHI
jgi:hypothetical protein